MEVQDKDAGIEYSTRGSKSIEEPFLLWTKPTSAYGFQLMSIHISIHPPCHVPLNICPKNLILDSFWVCVEGEVFIQRRSKKDELRKHSGPSVQDCSWTKWNRMFGFCLCGPLKLSESRTELGNCSGFSGRLQRCWLTSTTHFIPGTSQDLGLDAKDWTWNRQICKRHAE